MENAGFLSFGLLLRVVGSNIVTTAPIVHHVLHKGHVVVLRDIPVLQEVRPRVLGHRLY